MAKAIMAAHRGADADRSEISELEELGYLIIADAVQCLQHIRDAYTAKK
jgi:hypothetical protein